MVKTTTTNVSTNSSRLDQKNSNLTSKTILEVDFEEPSEHNIKNDTLMPKQAQSSSINDQNDWMHDELSKLWGDSEAEYFLNPNIIQRETNNSNYSNNPDENINKSTLNLKRNQNQGLFAFDLWDSLRDETTARLKNFELDKELQNLNYYEKVKETMNSSMNRKKISSNADLFHSDQEEMLKNRRRFDMNEIKRAKIFRNEIELMYRSSKMNQERVNLLRNSNPNPTTGGEFGLVDSEREKNSVISYLPPMSLNLYNNKPQKENPSLEFFSSPKMRQKLKNELEKKREKNHSHPSNLSMAEYNKADALFKKDNNQVKLKFLTEKPFRSYLSLNRDKYSTDHYNQANHHFGASHSNHDNENNNVNQSMNESSKHEKVRSLVLFENINKKSQNTNDNLEYQNNSIYPPLSMNALMEYKPSLLAPGVGEFDHGRPKFFRQDIH